MKKFTLTVLSLLCSTAGLLAAIPANGVYEVKHSDRGYLTQNVTANTLHPGDATLSGFTTSDKCVVGRNENGYQSYWYLYTSEISGNSYIFSASNGKFLAYENGTNTGTDASQFNLSSTPAPLDIIDARTSGYYQIHAHGVTAAAFSNSIGWGKNVAYRFASVSSDYDGIPHAFVTATGDFDQDVIDTAIAAINSVEATQQVVTFTFPEFGGQTLTMEATVLTGTDASEAIPSVAFFTATGVEDVDKVVSTENHAFTVTGSWTFPFALETAYRADMRQSAINNCNNFYYNSSTGQVETRNGTDAAAFVAERLFYVSSTGFSAAGQLKVTLHSIAVDEAQGFEVASTDKAIGTFSDTPTVFLVVTNSTGTEGVSLQHPDNSIGHVNDVEGKLGVWSDDRSQNDGGSYLRFKALEDSDYESLMSGDLSACITQEMLDAAKASNGADEVRALFNAAAPYLAAVAEAETLLASIENYTADHFGEDLGYFYGTDYDVILALVTALQETLKGTDAAAITVATAALAEEVAKVHVHLPEAGKFYRFKGVEGGYYITPNASTGQMVMTAEPSANSVFRFDEVEGGNNVFVPFNVVFQTGITGTHSLGGSETYTFYPSQSGVIGAFTIQSNTDASRAGQWVYNHYDKSETEQVVNRNSAFHERCNWYLEEVNEDGTGIEEVVANGEKKQGIYDLQGRRLSAPVKGINIINGKKVLVK